MKVGYIMKRLLIIICLVLFCTLNCFGANYKLPPEYKVEIEHAINSQYPYVVSEINIIAFKANKMYKQVLQNKISDIDFASENFDSYIGSPEFGLYCDLIDITKKYSYIDEEATATDYSGALEDVLEPYFKANNIDTTKLENLGRLTYQKSLEIESYYENLRKFEHGE